jgi:hypothetical protein
MLSPFVYLDGVQSLSFPERGVHRSCSVSKLRMAFGHIKTFCHPKGRVWLAFEKDHAHVPARRLDGFVPISTNNEIDEWRRSLCRGLGCLIVVKLHHQTTCALYQRSLDAATLPSAFDSNRQNKRVGLYTKAGVVRSISSDVAYTVL